ncbi:PCC domain-containing protein [Pseudonocardia alni]|uniref:PCC domain-containing protein n=1 Tax=Pseudonocardia alni TaxID=33907 RepID=UPI00280BEE5A|nr:DUF296 domain-containing protein [Pseudonocardia alni]
MIGEPITHGPVPVVHPGPRAPERRRSVPTRVTPVRTVLAPHTPIVEALSAVVEATGSTSAQVELVGGTFDRVSHCVPAADADAPTPISYSETHEAEVPAQVLTGAATVGFRDDVRFVHCHASWLGVDGRLRAGHLWPESVTGAVPIAVVIHPLAGVDMISSTDPETLMPTFAPVPSGGSAPVAGTRAVITRVLPGEDLGNAVEAVCAEHGFGAADVRASLGSLVGAVLGGQPDTRFVDCPCTEIISLTGVVDAGGTARLSGVVVDPDGNVHAGELVAGANIVAVTFELLVVERSEDR